ncbi:MAG: hypothetical protein QM820_06390 [Minicystis sp.]
MHTAALIFATIALAATSAGLGFVALADRTTDPFLPGLGAMFAAVGALGLVLGRVLGGSGEAPCPACGARVSDVERKGEIEGILCAGCGRFLRSDNGVLREMSATTIADTPIFGVAVTRGVRWPPGCVVCGEPATQTVPLSILGAEAAARAAISAYSGTGGLAVVGEERDEAIRLDAPHCAAHDDGASLVRGRPTGVVLLLRSLAYHRAFCELNETAPSESPEIGRSGTGGREGGRAVVRPR